MSTERLFTTPAAMGRAIDRQAATIDRLRAELTAARGVVDAARVWASSRHTHQPVSAHRHELKNDVESAVAAYDAVAARR